VLTETSGMLSLVTLYMYNIFKSDCEEGFYHSRPHFSEITNACTILGNIDLLIYIYITQQIRLYCNNVIHFILDNSHLGLYLMNVNYLYYTIIRRILN
jgi:hypothetical protein